MNDLKIQDIQLGIELSLKNAEQLYADAELLYNHGRIARAFTLAHLASEEITKVPLLFRVGLDVIAKNETDWKTLGTVFKNHNRKIFLGTILDVYYDAEYAIDNENTLEQVDAKVEEFNRMKNQSLYVSFNNGRFELPAEYIEEAIAVEAMNKAKQRIESVKDIALSSRKFYSALTAHPELVIEIKEILRKVSFDVDSNDSIQGFLEKIRSELPGDIDQ